MNDVWIGSGHDAAEPPQLGQQPRSGRPECAPVDRSSAEPGEALGEPTSRWACDGYGQTSLQLVPSEVEDAATDAAFDRLCHVEHRADRRGQRERAGVTDSRAAQTRRAAAGHE